MRLAPEDLTLAAAATVALALQFALGGQPVFLPVVLALIAVLGMPHGALDLALARHLWPLRSPERHALFLSLYLGLAAAVMALWVASPTFALAAFLGYSAWHFSDDWRGDSNPAGSFAGGLLVLALPAIAEPEGTAALLSALGAEGRAAMQGLAVAGIAGAIVFAASAWREPRLLLRMVFLAGCAALLSPLAYFFVFFCGLHSVRHMLKVVRTLGLDWRQGASRIVWPTLGTLASIAAAGILLAGRGLSIDETLMQIVFVAFAALTVPHMLLVDRFERKATAPGSGAVG